MVKRSNQTILKEINPEYSLEGLMLKLKLQYFDHLMRKTDGIIQAKILEWVAMPSSRGSSHQGLNPGLLHCRQILYYLSHQGSPRILAWVTYPFFRGSSRIRN